MSSFEKILWKGGHNLLHILNIGVTLVALASPKFAEILQLKFATLPTGCHLRFRKMDGTVSDVQLLSPPKPWQFCDSVTLKKGPR